MTMTTRSTNSLHRLLSQFALLLLVFLLGCFALSPTAQAVNPPPDGAYPGGNTAEGQDGLLSLTTGTYNTAIGFLSLKSNTAGNFNTALGAGTLLFNTADQNTATGAGALLNNTRGSFNTADGEAALFFNTTGARNTAVGVSALQSNTTGNFNTANGASAFFSNTTGSNNTAVGRIALNRNTTGTDNTALGVDALFSNTTANSNTAIGRAALSNNTTGTDNTATGIAALTSNTTGIANTALGSDSLFDNTTGSGNVALGDSSGQNVTTAGNVICIGANVAGADVSNSCYIGSIFGQSSSGGTAVFINSDGKLGTTNSSRRFKQEIKPMDHASEAILALKPVTFQYKSDTTNVSQFGLIAEEVAEVNPDLVVRDKTGEIYTVRYDAVNAMLLNEFLKEHRKVEQLKKDFESKLAAQEKQIKSLTSGLEKVNAQLEASKPTPRLVRK